MIGGEEGEGAVGAFGAEDHALGFQAGHFARGQVGDDDDLLSGHHFRCVVRADAGEDLDDLVRADFHFRAEKLFGLLYFLAGKDLTHAELAFGEIIVGADGLVLDRSFLMIVAAGAGLFCGLRRCRLCICRSFFFSFRFQGGELPGFDLVDLRLDVLELHAGEEDLRILRDLRAGDIVPALAEVFPGDGRGVDLAEDLLRGLGHEGGEQGRAGENSVHEVVEDGRKAGRSGRILRELPGLGLVDIFVAALEEPEDLGDRVRDAKLVYRLRMSELNFLSKTWICPAFSKVLHMSRFRSGCRRSTDFM